MTTNVTIRYGSYPQDIIHRRTAFNRVTPKPQQGHSRAPTGIHSMKYDMILSELKHANSFELYRLQCAIMTMLEDPDRIVQIKRQLRPGMEIEFFDETQNRVVPGQILEIRKTRVSIRDLQSQKKWNIPLYMLNVEGVSTDILPQQNKVDRMSLKLGDSVSFIGRDDRELFGTVMKLNPKRAKIMTSEGVWTVPYSMLHTIIEGESHVDDSVRQSLASPQEDIFAEFEECNDLHP